MRRRARQIVYVHPPKCGGTTYGSALRRRYIYSQGTVDLNRSRHLSESLFPSASPRERWYREHEVRRVLAMDLLVRGRRCISAHMQVNSDFVDGADATFLTVLRDPVSRFFSHYYYLRSHHNADATLPTLDEFIHTPDAHRIASQYLFFFGGGYRDDVAHRDAAVQQALSVLADFDFVGRLEDPSQCAHGICSVLGTTVRFPTRNVNSTRPLAGVAAAVQNRVEELCAEDIEIYRRLTS